MIDETQDQGVTQEGQEETPVDHAATETVEPQGEQTPTAPETEQPAKDALPLTDRGTKVAPEPQSQYYQQLKNENGDMRRLLSDPKSLKEYMRDLEGTQAPTEGKEDELSKIVEQSTLPNGQVDAHKLAQLMDERVTKKIEQGQKYIFENVSRAQQMGRAYDEDKSLVRSEHPELDPRQKDKYDPELETFIGERFLAQGGLQGKATLKQVADATFAYLDKVRGKATQAAETEVIRKRTGAITTSTVSGEAKDAEATMSPEQLLTQRVRAAVTRRS